MKLRFLTALAALWLAAAAPAAAEKLTVQTLDGRSLSFEVEVADTPAAQARGLMFVEHLPAGRGMLFPHDPPRRAGFWMRNTLIPLDLVFILPGGLIGQVVTRTDTQSDAVTRSVDKVSAVLELNAGTAAKLRFGIGDTVSVAGRSF